MINFLTFALELEDIIVISGVQLEQRLDCIIKQQVYDGIFFSFALLGECHRTSGFGEDKRSQFSHLLRNCVAHGFQSAGRIWKLGGYVSLQGDQQLQLSS